MSAQAQQLFPLSSLFRMLNLDGKDKILPVIRSNENYQQQMQQMQQQLDQMGQQMEQMAAENQNLKQEYMNVTNTLASVSARTGDSYAPSPGGGPDKVAQEGGGNETVPAVVAQARGNMQSMPV